MENLRCADKRNFVYCLFGTLPNGRPNFSLLVPKPNRWRGIFIFLFYFFKEIFYPRPPGPYHSPELNKFFIDVTTGMFQQSTLLSSSGVHYFCLI